MDIHKIYEYALKREYEGKHFFEENAKRLSQAAAVNAFQQLAGEEQKHINKGLTGDTVYGVEMERAGFFSQRAQSEIIDQTVAEAMVPDLPVLRMAYLIERDFAEYYEAMAVQVEGEAKQVLTMLSQWERRHERLFKLFFDRAFEEYSKMPWGG
jgi:rubrerythrin